MADDLKTMACRNVGPQLGIGGRSILWISYWRPVSRIPSLNGLVKLSRNLAPSLTSSHKIGLGPTPSASFSTSSSAMTFGTLFRRSKKVVFRHEGHSNTMDGSRIQRYSKLTELSFDASFKNVNPVKNIETITRVDETKVLKDDGPSTRRPGHSTSVGYWDVSTPAKAVMGLVLLVCSNVSLTATAQTTSGLPPPCDSKIYCYGDLLKTVQLAHLHKDSKHFVDMALRFPPEEIYTKFEKLMEESANDPSKLQVGEFVLANFKEPGAEFEPWVPDDWVENPAFLANISDSQFRSWANTLHGLWKELGRKISTSVRDEPDKYSQLYVDNPVVVPGGRFREFYYWDSYWTIDGLLLSGMENTVKGMLENFLQMVDIYGMVPNGGRVYYTRRSQPPYLIPMIKLYVDHTKDVEFIRNNIATMEKELNFWMNNRSVDVEYNGKTYNVVQYNSRVDEPRPESYREDYEAAASLTEANRTQLYVEYKSGAESGWDYSSRWFINAEKGGSNKGTLKNLAVTSIAPVDLNSLICYNSRIIAEFYDLLGNATKAAQYKALHEEKKTTLTELFWDEQDGIWYDVNIRNMTKRRYFYLSNLHPLWSGCFNETGSDAETVVASVINYLKKQKVLDYIGGVPTSTSNTGEQWDFPNAWAPLQHLIVMALRQNKDRHPEADSISFQLAQKWITSNWQGYMDVKAMFEKYNVNLIGAPGGGGEYEVVLGFGWTNGVALRFLNDFGDRLSAPEVFEVTGTASTSLATSPHVKGLFTSFNYILPVVAAGCYFAHTNLNLA